MGNVCTCRTETTAVGRVAVAAVVIVAVEEAGQAVEQAKEGVAVAGEVTENVAGN